jgi:hypothetical protein
MGKKNGGQNVDKLTTFEQVALWYIGLGFSTIPVRADKVPLVRWKEFQSRKPTPKEIGQWGKQYSTANIGIVTGAVSGIVVIDVEKGGDIFPYIQEGTVAAETGGGGFHFYYQHPGGHVGSPVRVKDSTDIRGDGAYVVAPPSRHTSGENYEWINCPSTTKLAVLPSWVCDSSKEKL